MSDDTVNEARLADVADSKAGKPVGELADNVAGLIQETAVNLRRSWGRIRLPAMSADEMARYGPEFKEHSANVELAAQLLESLVVKSSTQDEIEKGLEKLKGFIFVDEGYYQSDVDGMGRPMGGAPEDDDAIYLWSSEDSYNKGDVVEHDGKDYECLTDHGPDVNAPDVVQDGHAPRWKELDPPDAEPDTQDNPPVANDAGAAKEPPAGIPGTVTGANGETVADASNGNADAGAEADQPRHDAAGDAGQAKSDTVTAITADGNSSTEVPKEMRGAASDAPSQGAVKPEAWSMEGQYDIGDSVSLGEQVFQCTQKLTDSVKRMPPTQSPANNFWKEVKPPKQG